MNLSEDAKRVLVYLATRGKNGARTTGNEVAHALSIDRIAVTLAIIELERHGLVGTSASPEVQA